MAKDKVDIKNFMGVIQSTKQTDTGIEFSGAYMPSGNPVTAPGVTMAQLMKDKGIAEQWHQSIVGQYEQEKEQINRERRKADTPDLVIRGQDGDANDGGGSNAAAAFHQEEVEEELSEAECLREVLERNVKQLVACEGSLNAEIQKLQEHAERNRIDLQKARAALEAYDGV